MKVSFFLINPELSLSILPYSIINVVKCKTPSETSISRSHGRLYRSAININAQKLHKNYTSISPVIFKCMRHNKGPVSEILLKPESILLSTALKENDESRRDQNGEESERSNNNPFRDLARSGISTSFKDWSLRLCRFGIADRPDVTRMGAC